ncbi:MAG: guanylate kinase [Thermodesulforhabdaceae bacterium]
MEQRGSLFIVSAPSGAGKTTILKEVRLRLPDLKFSISYTTRPPRYGEEHGKDYFFVSREEFLKGIEDSRFVEWAYVHGNYYGTDRNMIENWIANGQDVILDIDVQGAREIKCQYPQSVTVFILPPSWRELERRLRLRGTDSSDVIERRLQNAVKEIEESFWYDYLIVNDEVSKAASQLMAIITSFRCRTSRQFGFLKRIFSDLKDYSSNVKGSSP